MIHPDLWECSIETTSRTNVHGIIQIVWADARHNIRIPGVDKIATINDEVVAML